jgi:type I restriction enzyme S subunit
MSGLLPQGWVETTIGAVTTSPAQRQPNVDETFVYIDISSIDRDTKRIENPQQLIGRDAPSRARKVVAAGDVLVSMTRPNLNAVALVPAELDGQIASTGFDVLRPNGVDPRWLFYIVRSADFVTALTDLVQGALYPAVKSSDVRSYRIQLPPLAEQQRIADTLDRLLARVDACRARLARVPALLKRFRQAVLAAAVAGRLTEDWRGENGTHIEWKTVSLGEVADEVKNGYGLKPNEAPPGTPILRISSVRPFRIDYQDIRYVPENATVTQYLLRKNDLLFTRYNGSIQFVGVCALVKELPSEPFAHPDKLIRVRLDQGLAAPGYIEIAANSPSARDIIERSAKTSAGQTGISGGDLKNLPIPLPSLAEQHEIVRRVETLFAYTDRLDARLAAAQARVAQLTPSLLGKAFRGVLGTTTADGESNG